MPLTEEERRKLQALTGGQAAPSGLPPDVASIIQSLPQGGAYPSSISAKGMRMTLPPSRQAVERDLLLKQANDLLTERSKSRQDSTKRRAEVEQQMAALKRSMGKVDSLFSEAETELPPLEEEGLALRGAQAKRGLSNLLGQREAAKGFADTFPVEVRKHLKELEKGGRFTDQDIEQMLKAVSPRDLESSTRREAKRARLLKSFQDEHDLYQHELETLGGAPPTSGSAGMDERVSVIAPDGTPGHIPRAQVERARQQGYRVAP